MSVSVARQLELSRKYGVSEDLINTLKNEKADETKWNEAYGKFTAILGNAIIGRLADPDDVEDLSALVPDRFGVSREDYVMVLNLGRLLD